MPNSPWKHLNVAAILYMFLAFLGEIGYLRCSSRDVNSILHFPYSLDVDDMSFNYSDGEGD